MTCEFYSSFKLLHKEQGGEIWREKGFPGAHTSGFADTVLFALPWLPRSFQNERSPCQADKPEIRPTLRESLLPFHFQAALENWTLMDQALHFLV